MVDRLNRLNMHTLRIIKNGTSVDSIKFRMLSGYCLGCYK